MSSTLLLADVAFTVALVGLTVVALSRSATRGGDIALAATGNTLSPEAIHRTIDVAKLPVQQIDDMSVVFSDSAPRAP
jgi:hypothetical protein